jgi:hypothetical protein
MREFLSGGPMMWPMLVVAVGITWLAVRTAAALRAGSPASQIRPRLDALLFWGGMSVLLGLFGTVSGVVVMASWIEQFGPVAATTLWNGIGVALVPLLFGLLLFVGAACAWLALRLRMLAAGGDCGELNPE